MLTIQKTELILSGVAVPMDPDGDGWRFGDVSLTKTEENGFSIHAQTTPVCMVRVTFGETEMENALVLGDAWERAYGDLQWEPAEASRHLPWYFFAHDGIRTLAFGVKTGPNALCFWQYDGVTPVLTMDLRSGTNPLRLEGRNLNLCTVVSAEMEGDVHQACAAFCRMLCDNPRKVDRPIFGGNDWYCNYGNNSFDKIRLHAQRVAACAQNCAYPPYMVIDDGWQLCHLARGSDYNGGPWGYCNANFGDMAQMAAAIREAGAIPGIWFRPLETMEKLPKEYYLKRDFPNPTLDPSVPEVLELVKRDVKQIVSWGYRLIKHDFSSADIFGKWGFEMGESLYYGSVSFADDTRTTAQIIKDFYLAIREAAGEEVLIMGCNTFSHLSAGIMDIQRTGDDTSGRDWARTKKYGVNTLAFRMMQHGAFYCVDADCVGITKDIPWEKNRQWLDVLAKSGTPLFVSIAQNAFSAEVGRAVQEAFENACAAEKASVPVDWMESETPHIWKSQWGEDHYSW